MATDSLRAWLHATLRIREAAAEEWLPDRTILFRAEEAVLTAGDVRRALGADERAAVLAEVIQALDALPCQPWDGARRLAINDCLVVVRELEE